MQTKTRFDTSRHHIHVLGQVRNHQGEPSHLEAVIDTGAPWTEVSDKFLLFAGLLDEVNGDVVIKPGLQTQKYGRLILPELSICGQTMTGLEIKVSRFEQSWGISALIGLDFFRRFRVTIDYSDAVLEVSRV